MKITFFRNVGKTSLKRRLMGISNENENENACKLVQEKMKEENLTHGVEISSWKGNDMSFSLWDFAGKN